KDLGRARLANALPLDQLRGEIELSGLREGRSSIEREKIAGLGRVEGKSAQGRRVGLGSEGAPGRVAGGGALLRVERREPDRRVGVGGELAVVVEPEKSGVGCSREDRSGGAVEPDNGQARI